MKALFPERNLCEGEREVKELRIKKHKITLYAIKYPIIPASAT